MDHFKEIMEISPQNAEEIIRQQQMIIRQLAEIRRDNEYFKEILENLRGETIQRNNQTPEWNLIRMYEKSIGRPEMESVLHTYNEAQQKEYARKCQEWLRFGREVDECLAGILNPRNAVYIGDTPSVFRETCGCRQHKMLMTQAHIRKSIGRGYGYHQRMEHSMSLEHLKRIPEALSDPALIMQSSTREDTVLAVLPYKDMKNAPVVIAIAKEGEGVYEEERVKSNFILSAYGKDNLNPLITHMESANKIYYVNKEKSQELALPLLQLQRDHLAPAFDYIVENVTGKVNNSGKTFSEESHENTQDVIYGTAKEIRQPLHRL